MSPSLPQILEIAPAEYSAHRGALAALLVDAVDSGASVGFLPPLSEQEALAYWDDVGGRLGSGALCLLAAFDGGALIGSVQLGLPGMPNGAHRAEVMKLLVLRAARRRGVGRALMAAVEACARREGRSLLVLDTLVGDTAEGLYARWGYAKAGEVPAYARTSDGRLRPTAIMYRHLSASDGRAPPHDPVGAAGPNESLPQQLTALGRLLADVDSRLAKAPVAPAGLEHLQQSVDGLRTSMWAILSAGHGVTAPAKVERLRLRRAIEGLRAIAQDVAHRPEAARHPEHAELAAVARAICANLGDA